MTHELQWYRTDQVPLWDDRLPEVIRQNLEHCALARGPEIARMAVLALAYEREWWNDDEYQQWQKDPFHDRLARDGLGPSPFTINKLAHSVDAVLNKVIEQPRITIQSRNGTFEQLRQFDTRQRAINGIRSTPEVSEVDRLWARDGLVKRVGWSMWRYDGKGGRITKRRLHPWQVHIDPHDALNTGEPTFCHVVELVDRDLFLAWYENARSLGDAGDAIPIPNHDARIGRIRTVPRATEHVDGHSNFWQGAYFSTISTQGTTVDRTDRIRVVHSWRRSYSPGTSGGRYTCSVLSGTDSVVALDYKFRRDTLPVVWYMPTPADSGMRGIALADHLLAVQGFINYQLWKIVKVQIRYGHHKVFVPKNSPKATITALLAAGINAVPVAEPNELPQIVPPQVLAPEQLQLLEWALAVPTNELGITSVVTEGRSQLGANASGRAQVEERLRTRDRQNHLIEAFSTAQLRSVRELLNTTEDAVRLDPEFSASFKDSSGLWTSTPWAELTQNHEEWVLGFEETGQFGDSRAARISKVLDDATKGLISPQSAFSAIVGPVDDERLTTRETAMQRAIEYHLWLLSDPDADHAQAQPSRDMDIPLLLELTTEMINLAIAQRAKPETVVRYREYLFAAAQLLPPPESLPVSPTLAPAPQAPPVT